MKLNIENCARNGDEGGKAWALDELVRNLKEMRDRSNTGDMQAAVTEFFEVFRFNDGVGVAALAAQPGSVGDGATIAGLESAVGHLSTMVDEQRRLLVEVEQVCGRDAYGMEFEDGDSELIDKVRAHLAATTSAPTPEPMSAPTEAKPAQDAVDAWQPISTAPRDGTNILLRWGIDGVSQAKYVPGLPHPWKFIDTNDGVTWLVNHCIDGLGGPSHWMPMPSAIRAAISAKKGGV